jgi:hypothetical protein
MGDSYQTGGPTNGGYAPDGYAQQDHYGHKRQRDDDYGPNKRMAGESQGGSETVYRLLCDLKIVGGMIGKGGSNIRDVQQSTGAFIQVVHEAPPHCSERVFVIASPRDQQSEYNAAQQALFSMFEKQMALERNVAAPGGPFLRSDLHPLSSLILSIAGTACSGTYSPIQFATLTESHKMPAFHPVLPCTAIYISSS